MSEHKQVSFFFTNHLNSFQIITAQQAFIRTGIPASLEHRRTQLEKLRDVIVKNKDRFTEAVYKDLRRDQRVTVVWEISTVIQEIDYCLANLEDWMQPEYVEKTLSTMLDTPMIVREPYGVVLLMSAWNYPVFLVLLPLVTILAAGRLLSDFLLQYAFRKHCRYKAKRSFIRKRGGNR
jgi:aldehyde dehydrogenase (NAD+)